MRLYDWRIITYISSFPPRCGKVLSQGWEEEMWFTAYGPCDWSIWMLWIQEGVLSAVKATADSPSWWTLPRNLTAAFMLQSQCRSESCPFLFLFSFEKMWINGQSPNYWPSTSSCTLSHGLPVSFFLSSLNRCSYDGRISTRIEMLGPSYVIPTAAGKSFAVGIIMVISSSIRMDEGYEITITTQASTSTQPEL